MTLLRRLGPSLERSRLPIQSSADASAWFLAIVGSQFFRFDFSLSSDQFSIGGLLVVAAAAAGLQVLIGLAMGLYRNRWRYGTLDEVGHLARAVAVVTVLLAGFNNLLGLQLVPSSVPIVGALGALCVMGGVRYVWRLIIEHSMRPSSELGEPVIIVGAGEGGEQVVTSMLRTSNSPYIPVALLDDDPAKRNLSIKGVPVVGTHADLAEQARERGVDTVVVAIPSASPSLLREISETALRCELDVCVLPPIDDLFGAPVGVGDIRALTETDLLGRHQIDTDIESIAHYITGRSVLVTGAGGSIGSELCRQLSRFAPSVLTMLDRDESALHSVQLSIEGRALLDTPDLVVADIRDGERIKQVFADTRPDVVFHAAALKHLPLLEMHPSEALKTNVVGTQNVLDAAIAADVSRFVNISTDKAADPTSVLGWSKRIAECLTTQAATASAGTFLSVRFGNVLGSRGSVLTTFRAQIASGGPVTVTDPEVTRFFMTIEEAVQLLIQAGAVGRDGEALVLDMGEPVRIDDVARRLVAEAPRAVEIVYTGLRPGEKLHEDLWGREETDERPAHPLISHVSVPPLRFEEVTASTDGLDDPHLVRALTRLAGGVMVESTPVIVDEA